MTDAAGTWQGGPDGPPVRKAKGDLERQRIVGIEQLELLVAACLLGDQRLHLRAVIGPERRGECLQGLVHGQRLRWRPMLRQLPDDQFAQAAHAATSSRAACTCSALTWRACAR